MIRRLILAAQVMLLIGVLSTNALAGKVILECNDVREDGTQSYTTVSLDRENRSVAIIADTPVDINVMTFSENLVEFTYWYNPPQGLKGRFSIRSDGYFTNVIPDFFPGRTARFRGQCVKKDRLF